MPVELPWCPEVDIKRNVGDARPVEMRDLVAFWTGDKDFMAFLDKIAMTILSERIFKNFSRKLLGWPQEFPKHLRSRRRLQANSGFGCKLFKNRIS